VPLSFGFEAAGDGAVVIYVHGAKTGFKHDLITRDNHVCVEADIFHGYLKSGEGDNSSITALFESVIGFGVAEAVDDAEAEHGVELMLGHCGYPEILFDKADIDRVIIYKITLTHVTGKRNLKKT
jgi:nitroimidazol reductase NimA-like FMN-containing flavoprotein (pyridoxamine 5'-phosphate oxidase superfamily)